MNGCCAFPDFKCCQTAEFPAFRGVSDEKVSRKRSYPSRCRWGAAWIVDDGSILRAGNLPLTVFGDEMANDRAISRRKGECRRGSSGQRGRLLFWGGRRRGVEDHGRRHGLEADIRQRARGV